MKKTSFFTKYKSLISFLMVEIVALLAFNFGGSGNSVSSILMLFGVLIAIGGVIFLIGMTKEKKTLLYLIPPVFILMCISGIASFNEFSKIFSSFSNIVLFLALPSAFIIGVCLRKFADFKMSTIILIIGGVFALLTLICLISTLASYGFFYSLKFKDTPFYFYNGEVSDVTKEMFWLNGFKFTETSIGHGSLYALLAASFLPGLLFVSYKKNKNEFLLTLLIGAVGLLALIVLPNIKAIVILLVSSIGAVIYKFGKNSEKTWKITGISLISLVSIVVLFFILSLVNVAIGYKFPGFLNKLFVTNGIMKNVTPVMELVLGNKGENLLGIIPYEINQSTIFINTGIFEVELLKEIGVIGTFIFLAFGLEMFYFLFRYMRKKNDSDNIKVIVLTLLLSFFIYSSLSNEIFPYIHDELALTFLRNPLVFVILFFFGFMFYAEESKEKKHEK